MKGATKTITLAELLRACEQKGHRAAPVEWMPSDRVEVRCSECGITFSATVEQRDWFSLDEFVTPCAGAQR